MWRSAGRLPKRTSSCFTENRRENPVAPGPNGPAGDLAGPFFGAWLEWSWKRSTAWKLAVIRLLALRRRTPPLRAESGSKMDEWWSYRTSGRKLLDCGDAQRIEIIQVANFSSALAPAFVVL
jgi:hypothetical protein